MARSATKTSIYFNYAELGRRSIYGIEFPEGLRANQELPMQTILTPTTKAEEGHDSELTDDQARELSDGIGGAGTWQKIKDYGEKIFGLAYLYHRSKGLILVDTKYEFGLDADGQVMVIDEVHTPDSSRFWKAETYYECFRQGKDPETFDKDILRRHLASQGFTGEGDVPSIPPQIIEKMSEAYKVPYKMVTGRALAEQNSDPSELKEVIERSLSSRKS